VLIRRRPPSQSKPWLLLSIVIAPILLVGLIFGFLYVGNVLSKSTEGTSLYDRDNLDRVSNEVQPIGQ
jgi:hypothetical protein